MDNPFRRQKRHLGERVAEWSIRIVASFSIIVIFLIFLFVFREASSLFTSTSNTSPETQHSGEVSSSEHGGEKTDGKTEKSPSSDTPEAYNSDVEDISEPEAYNSDVEDITTATPEGIPGPEGQFIYESKNPNYPEIYNPATGLIPDDIDDVEDNVNDDGAPAPIPLAENLTSMQWQPVSEQPKFGIMPLLIGTVKTTFVAILIGAPLGILAAIFCAFFLPGRIRNLVKPGIELLAAFPSVVIGFFCLFTVAPWLFDSLGLGSLTDYRLNALIGGIGLSLAVIPIVFTIAEDSLSAVPRTLWEASLALGSTQWQTAYRVMLPAAAPGVFAAVLLGVGRAFGETMIAIMATGNAPMSTWNILTPGRTVAATIGSEMGEVVWGSEHYGVLFFLGALLFVFSFALNAVTELYVKQRLIKKFQGA